MRDEDGAVSLGAKGGREPEKKRIDFLVHSCSITLRSYKKLQKQYFLGLIFPYRGAGDKINQQQVTLWGNSASHPSFFSFPFLISLHFPMFDHANWNRHCNVGPGVILAFTCLADKSLANWDVTLEPASPCSPNVSSQKAVSFDMDPTVGSRVCDANLNHYVACLKAGHQLNV